MSEQAVLRIYQEARLTRIVVLMDLASIELENLETTPGPPIVGREREGMISHLDRMMSRCQSWLDEVHSPPSAKISETALPSQATPNQRR